MLGGRRRRCSLIMERMDESLVVVRTVSNGYFGIAIRSIGNMIFLLKIICYVNPYPCLLSQTLILMLDRDVFLYEVV